MAGALVVRPEPGNAATLARLRGMGLEAIGWPLFAAVPTDWTAPDPSSFDAVLVTSAQAVRLAGAPLSALAHLPVIAVGAATATAARSAGLTVVATGERDVAAALAAGAAAGLHRPLHLAGRDHVATGHRTVIVYASAALAVDRAAFVRAAAGRVVLLHSSRAAASVAALVAPADRGAVAVAAISPAVLAAAGQGWRIAAAAPHPGDAALCALAQAIDRSGPRGDKGP